MNESILISIKKLLGIDATYDHFDADIIMHINSVITILSQLGVQTADGFSITGDDETWSDLLGNSYPGLDGVRTYVYLKVRLLFDPPVSASVIDSMNRLASEFEWRINVSADRTKT